VDPYGLDQSSYIPIGFQCLYSISREMQLGAEYEFTLCKFYAVRNRKC